MQFKLFSLVILLGCLVGLSASQSSGSTDDECRDFGRNKLNMTDENLKSVQLFRQYFAPRQGQTADQVCKAISKKNTVNFLLESNHQASCCGVLNGVDPKPDNDEQCRYEAVKKGFNLDILNKVAKFDIFFHAGPKICAQRGYNYGFQFRSDFRVATCCGNVTKSDTTIKV